MNSSAYYLPNVTSILALISVNFTKLFAINIIVRLISATLALSPLFAIWLMWPRMEYAAQINTIPRLGLYFWTRRILIPPYQQPRNVFTFHSSRLSALKADVFSCLWPGRICASSAHITWPFLIRLARRTPFWANNKNIYSNPSRLHIPRTTTFPATGDFVAPPPFVPYCYYRYVYSVCCWFCRDDFYWWGAYSA